MSKQKSLFHALEHICHKPKPFEAYTTPQLWTDPYIAQKMLELHLNPEAELASRNAAFVEESATWMIKHFNIRNTSKVCDFGCGPGLYTTQFAQTGAQVTGIDFSENSIRHAKQAAEEKSLKIDYLLQDYLKFSTDQRFDLITMIYCDFGVLNPEQRKNLLKTWHATLEDGGSLFIDVFSLQQFKETKEEGTYEHVPENDCWSAGPCYAFQNTFKYEKEQLLLHKWTVIEENRTREILNWLQCYSLESLKQELQENGFELIEYYSDVSGEPYSPDSKEIAIRAKKIP